ncbi:MAG TPA: L,D-transpeptidase family protein [Acidimicrobiales bacterium]
MRRLVARALVVALVAGVTVVPFASIAQAQSSLMVTASSQIATRINTSMPVVRLHFTRAVNAQKLPALKVSPALATDWQQISPLDVQAVVVGKVAPILSYSITLPTSFRCGATCAIAASRVVQTTLDVNVTWEQQLLAQLNYLPVSFTPLVTGSTPATQVPGVFAWRFPLLPARFSSQWQQGVDNVVVTGAVMNFQNVHGLATTGVVDSVTWNALVNAANSGQVNPATYNYVDVSEASPEVLTLYENGVGKFKSLVNTGISVASTAVGTYHVYLRFTTQTMSGTNPNGTHYSDPGIPWVSYFNGGDALHGFIRSGYGYPQSLGCVEMPFASAATIWPHTPIGTLVTVHA